MLSFSFRLALVLTFPFFVLPFSFGILASFALLALAFALTFFFASLSFVRHVLLAVTVRTAWLFAFAVDEHVVARPLAGD